MTFDGEEECQGSVFQVVVTEGVRLFERKRLNLLSLIDPCPMESPRPLCEVRRGLPVGGHHPEDRRHGDPPAP